MDVSGFTAASGRQQYMQLLVAQLQNQDPISPVKQEDFIQQLAQFATLEGIENLNDNFEQMRTLQDLTQSAGLIGKTATFRSDPTRGDQSAQVDEVRLVDGKVVLVAEGQEISINSLLGVKGQ